MVCEVGSGLCIAVWSSSCRASKRVRQLKHLKGQDRSVKIMIINVQKMQEMWQFSTECQIIIVSKRRRLENYGICCLNSNIFFVFCYILNWRVLRLIPSLNVSDWHINNQHDLFWILSIISSFLNSLRNWICFCYYLSGPVIWIGSFWQA